MSSAASERVDNSLIGIAGVHYVASELSRRGLVAMPTTRNTAGIDILVAEPDGSSQAVLQVKTSGKVSIKEEGRQWWPMPMPDNCLRAADAYYVFVRWREDLERFEAFMEDAASVAKQVQDNLDADRKVPREDFPSWGLPKDPGGQAKLADNWRNWRPNSGP